MEDKIPDGREYELKVSRAMHVSEVPIEDYPEIPAAERVTEENGTEGDWLLVEWDGGDLIEFPVDIDWDEAPFTEGDNIVSRGSYAAVSNQANKLNARIAQMSGIRAWTYYPQEVPKVASFDE